jgi:hypothetical protein
MVEYTPEFTLEVQEVKGACPAGEVYAKQNMAAENGLMDFLYQRVRADPRTC